jgi:phage tail tape-measure protein
VALTACAGPEPIFKSTTYLQLHGKQQAEQEAAVCRVKAERAGLQHGTNRSGNAGAGAALGVIGGAAVGASAGLIGGPTGIAIGAAAGGAVGGILGLFAGTYKPVQPQQDYAAFIERCLKEKGYDTEGWQ